MKACLSHAAVGSVRQEFFLYLEYLLQSLAWALTLVKKQINKEDSLASGSYAASLGKKRITQELRKWNQCGLILLLLILLSMCRAMLVV